MGTVIEFNNNAFLARNDFTPREKTLLGDIAMYYRDQGMKLRLLLKGSPKCPVASFFDADLKREFVLVTKHRVDGAHFEYKLSPIKAGTGCDSRLNFSDVETSCRDYILDLATRPS